MSNAPAPDLTVVVPALNERENLAPLLREIRAALEGRLVFEILIIDDGSDDGTEQVLRELMAQEPCLRALRHARRAGQSAALLTGVRQARAPLVATLDGDLQNDPADLPALHAAWAADPDPARLGLVAGQRRKRRDGLGKRLSSRLANTLRRALLRDATRDTGCGLKLFPRAVVLGLPAFAGLHRFLPALVKGAGYRVLPLEVNHRPRRAGRTKYGLWNRLWVGIGDLLMVWWLLRRRRDPGAVTPLEARKE